MPTAETMLMCAICREPFEDTDLQDSIDGVSLKEALFLAIRSIRPVRGAASAFVGRAERVLDERFGLTDRRVRTYKEIGLSFGVTRERIRQIEGKALRMLRHGTRQGKLRRYLK